MKKKTNKLRIAAFAAVMLIAGTANAQRTSTSANAATDFTKEANTIMGAEGGSVKVVDNKGTIKYLQANNGVTVFTDTAPDGGIITTWQLGGTLTDDTYIDASGAAFALDGLELVTDLTTASTDADADLDGSIHGVGTTAGFTVLIRDEVTGETKKIRVSDLLQVDGIRVEYTQAIGGLGTPDATGNATVDVPITVTGLPVLTVGSTYSKLFVYRNGVKLRTIEDFVATADTVTINFDAIELPMYAGDVIEIQYIK